MDRSLLKSLWTVVDDVIRPRAAAADLGTVDGIVRENVSLLAGRGMFGLGVPRDCGGLGADYATQQEYTEIVASACGVTAFTQQQLRIGVKYVANADNESLRRSLLPMLAAGRILCGIGISQLRRSGEPLLTGVTIPGGVRVNGVVPWVTAWPILDAFVVGFPVDDGSRHVYAYIDRERHADSLVAGEVMPLVVMRASGTVAVTVENLVLRSDEILSMRPADDIQDTDRREITAHTALPLGCARACERYLREMAADGCKDDVNAAATGLMFEINHWRREALTWNCECAGHADYRTYALRARGAALVLAVRAAHATVAAAGGSAQLETSTPQRLLREAQFYTNAVQTTDVRRSVLTQLISPYYGM